MNAEFDWWLLLVGIVGGAALVWLVVGDMRRRDDEVADDERSLEAEWIADAFGAAGRTVDAATVGEILDLHRAYLAGPAPELDPVDQVPIAGAATAAANGPTASAAVRGEGQAAIAPAAIAPAGVTQPGLAQPATTPPGITQPTITPAAPGPGGGQPHRAPGDGS